MQDLDGSGKGREVRGMGHMWAGLGEKGLGQARGTVTFGIYSNQFQTSLICFDQKVDLPNSKNSK
jgi:hypothetical protein